MSTPPKARRSRRRLRRRGRRSSHCHHGRGVPASFAGEGVSAITDPAKLTRWFMPSNFAPVVGHRFTLHRTANCDLHFSDTIECEVLDVRPERVLAYSWTDGEYRGELNSIVTWTLQPEGRGTRLFVEHRGFAAEDEIQQRAHGAMTAGWRIYLIERLPAALSTFS